MRIFRKDIADDAAIFERILEMPGAAAVGAHFAPMQRADRAASPADQAARIP
jgi:hypothetical protein